MYKKYIVLICLIVLLIHSCSQIRQTSHQNSTGGFQLIILKQNWHDLDLGYTYEEAFPILKTLSTEDNLFVVNKEDIEIYDWSWQTITLTQKASGLLSNALANQGKLNEKIEAFNSLIKMAGNWGNNAGYMLEKRCFVVKYNDNFLYGGIFIDPTSQLKIDYPIIRVSMTKDNIRFSILPIHLPFVSVDPVDENGNIRETPIWNKTDDQALNSIALELGNSFIKEDSRTEYTNKLRGLIRDVRIKSIFNNSGT